MRTGHSTESMIVCGWPWYGHGDNATVENSYTARFADALRAAGVSTREFKLSRVFVLNYDILHVHWPEKVTEGRLGFRSLARTLALASGLIYLNRVRRIPVVWTAHNIRPHFEHSRLLLRIVREAMKRTVGGVVALTSASLDELGAEIPWTRNTHSAVAYHGTYEGEFDESRSRAECRAELGLPPETPVVAFVGVVAPYKGIDRLLELAAQDESSTRYWVCGKPASPGYGEEILGVGREMSNVILDLGWATSRHLAEVVRAADLVVLPYRTVLNSGSVMIPVGLGTRVLVPRTGSMEELQDILGGGALEFFVDELSAGDIARALSFDDAPTPNLAAVDWSVGASRTIALYRSLIGRGKEQ